MRRTIIALSAALMTFGSLSVAPVSAAPPQYGDAELTNAQFSFSYGDEDRDGRRGRDRDWEYDRDWDDGDRRGDRFERRGKAYYFNGHRGERQRRSGWRQYNGYWFPPAAFSFSITLNPGRGKVSISARHREWCDDRYISYRVSDNTFKPKRGPRKECVSPYWPR